MAKYHAIIVEATKVGLAGLGNKFVSVRPRMKPGARSTDSIGSEAEQARKIEAAAAKIARKRQRNLDRGL